MILGYILTCTSLIYIIILYGLWLTRVEKNYKEYPKGYSIIIPCYNEGFFELIKCVNSCRNAEGLKQIIVIDNNSNKPETISALKHLSKFNDIQILEEKRQGKRFAHAKGLTHAKYNLICFLDSDTIVESNAFLELIKPFQDKRIGAVCGNIRIMNREDNFLTRCLDTMYWNSFEFYRKAVSGLGYLYVCSGALSAYRKGALLKLEKEYLNQKFMGSECSISDDTFMTVRLQSRLGYKIEYMETAIGYTYSPNKIKGFWKQLVRWRQGFLRETLLMWKEPKKNIIPLFIDAQTNLILQTSIAFLRVYFFLMIIFNFNIISIVNYLIIFLVSAMMMSTAQIVNRPSKILYILAYSFIYDFFFVFTFIHALIKIRNQGKWGTR